MFPPISPTPSSLEFQIFNSEPPQCQVEWGDETHSTQCINVAVWIADCHDELDHTQAQILFCAECKIVAEYKRYCECGEDLIRNMRRL